jgi:hypothetical protein
MRSLYSSEYHCDVRVFVQDDTNYNLAAHLEAKKAQLENGPKYIMS